MKKKIPDSFCEASITLITRFDKEPENENRKKKNYRPISLVNTIIKMLTESYITLRKTVHYD